MDEYATPIEQIRPEMNSHSGGQEQVPVNYSDMLQVMEQQKQHQSMGEQQMPQQDYPPPPIVQSRMPPQAHMNMNFIQPKKEEPEKSTDNMSQMQKDVMYILIPSIILYSTPIQTHLLRLVPSLFKDDKPSIVGNIVNGAIIAMVYVGLKNMKINFGS